MNAEAIQAMFERRGLCSPPPENAMLLRTNLLIGFPEKDSFAFCALSHVSTVPPLQHP